MQGWGRSFIFSPLGFHAGLDTESVGICLISPTQKTTYGTIDILPTFTVIAKEHRNDKLEN